MALLMIMTAERRIMGAFVVTGWLRGLGWAATALMAAAVVGMAGASVL